MQLREHGITLTDEKLTLRPMTEADWDVLLRWNNDPEVLFYAEGHDVSQRSLDDVQNIYRYVSQTAFNFIIEMNSQPIGECWLQQMNLERIIQCYPDQDCRRIDLMIGEKTLWGKGLGTRTIRLLTRFAFEQEKADYIFGCEIADYNPRSRGAFQKAGYQMDTRIEMPPGQKARYGHDFIISRSAYFKQRTNHPPS